MATIDEIDRQILSALSRDARLSAESIQSGESACSKAVRAITLAGACCSNRARTTGHADPDFVDASVIPQSWKNRITLKGVSLKPHPSHSSGLTPKPESQTG